MKLKTVDPRSIKVPDVRVTNYMDDGMEAEFAGSVREAGILEPPVCMQVGEELYVVDGRNRLEQAIALGLTTVRVIVREGNMADLLLQNLTTAVARGKPRLAEMVRVVAELFHTHNCTYDQIEARTGLTTRYIDDLRIIWEGGPELRQAVDDGWLLKTHALLLAGVKDPEVRDRLLYNQKTYGWPASTLESAIKRAEEAREATQAAQQPQEPQPPPQVGCHFCGQLQDLAHIATVNICPGCNGIAYEVIKGALLKQGVSDG